MEDLLWDFDDVTTPEEFNKERYTALQAATRAFALELTETSKRFRPRTPTSPTHLPASYPPLPPLPMIPPKRSDISRGLPPPGPRQPSRSVTVSEDRLIHIGRDHPEVAEQGRDVESKEPPTTNEFESQKGSHSSWLLSDSSGPNLANPVETSAKGETTDTDGFNLLDASANGRVPSWSETSNDKCSVAEGSIRSTETLNGSSTDTALTPAPSMGSFSMVDFKQDDKGPAGKPNIDKIIARPPLVRKASLTIGFKSSYHRLKGICQGGVKFRMDGHWESIVTTSEFSAGAGASGGEMLRASDGIIPLQFEEEAKIGRCGECSYAHDLEEMERDASLAGKRISPNRFFEKTL